SPDRRVSPRSASSTFHGIPRDSRRDASGSLSPVRPVSALPWLALLVAGKCRQSPASTLAFRRFGYGLTMTYRRKMWVFSMQIHEKRPMTGLESTCRRGAAVDLAVMAGLFGRCLDSAVPGI